MILNHRPALRDLLIVATSFTIGSLLVISIVKNADTAFSSLFVNSYAPHIFLAGYLALIHYLAYASIIKSKKEKSINSKLEISARVFKNSKEGMIITDKNSIVIDANAAFSTITGFVFSDVFGKTVNLISLEMNDLKMLEDIGLSTQKFGLWTGEAWSKCKDLKHLQLQARISLVRDTDVNEDFYIYEFSDANLPTLHKEQIRKITNFDSLTALPNNITLKENLKTAIVHASEKNTLLAVCYIDLDGFKKINEVIGHENGDKVLVSVAQKLSDFVGYSNTVARLGGDEFVVLLGGLDNQEEVECSIKKLLEVIQMPCLGGFSVVKPTASIGVAIYPSDASDCETLVRHADVAMFDSKLKGKNQYQIFDSK
jgi:diguanylate cyclase (GGDEF)-like protein/PAS domain S-box-containing protein